MYLDDILMYSTSCKEHLQHLEAVFQLSTSSESKKLNTANVNFLSNAYTP